MAILQHHALLRGRLFAVFRELGLVRCLH
jgi:hypothetical protein